MSQSYARFYAHMVDRLEATLKLPAGVLFQGTPEPMRPYASLLRELEAADAPRDAQPARLGDSPNGGMCP